MRTTDYQCSRTSRRNITLHNTNHLVGGDVDVCGGKTGFISRPATASPRCCELPQGDQVAVVVLGAKSNTGALLGNAAHLVNWLNEKTPALVTAKPPAPQQD